MLVEQFKAVIYTMDKVYVEAVGEELDALDSYSIGPFPTYELAKNEIAKAAVEESKFDHGSIEKVFVWQEV